MVKASPRLPSDVKGIDSRPFLSCHIHGTGDDAGFYVAWPMRLGGLEQVDCSLKLRTELDHWFRLSLQLAEGKQSASAPFRDDFDDLGEAGIARTLRTLRGIEALLLGRSSFYPDIEKETKKAEEKVAALRSATIPCDFDPAWNVSLLLLLIRAAAWSQTGWQQPYLWEAYSAWHARTAHERTGWLGERGRRILTFLVRFQSAPGQYARETGDVLFYEAARRVADDTGVELKLLLTALGVLAVAQDFRSMILMPDLGGDAPREEERKLCGHHGYPHKPTRFFPFWDFVDDPDSHPTPSRHATWSYSGWLLQSLKKEKLRTFQDLVEARHEDVFAFSFGRDYRSNVQQRRVVEGIRKVLKDPPALGRIFTFNSIQVPDCLWAEAAETLVEIRLTDDVTANDMVFHDCEPTEPPRQLSSAWEIYCHLFQSAVDEELILWPRQGKGSRYCPTALIGRFLDAAHRLRPAECVSIPIRVNEGKSFFLHLPEVPAGTDAESREARAAARYVPAWVLNQIMMREVTSCRVALEDLGETVPGRFWQAAIQEAISENHYEIFFHRYLSDYLAEPSQVLLNQGHVDLLPLLEGSSVDPGSEAWALIRAVPAEDVLRSKPVVLGIDIGGSFVKMCFYRLEEDTASLQEEASRLVPVGTDFRILTKAPAEKGKELEIFIDRLRKRIREESDAVGVKKIDAIGVSWPGPVRQRRVQGTSGILASLGFSRDISDNDIRKIMDMNLARRLAEGGVIADDDDALSPAVTLLNDGDAHALGTLADAFLGRGLGGTAAQLGVVVKAGTGTAGALIRNGLPAPGLMEFGKLIVDLGYDPVTAPKYPRGVANLYCSSRTLPAVMARRLPHLEHLDPPVESIEIGRLAEAGEQLVAGKPRQAHSVLRQLVWDAGKIAVAWLLLKIDPELDVVALEELSRNWLKNSNTALRKKVIRYLALDGTGGLDTRKEFRDRIRSYGKQRVILLLNLDAIDATTFWKLFRRRRTVEQKALTELRRTTDAARQAIAELGLYIGDLLALLYLAHRMDYAVLGGGVLSSTSGSRAREAAVRRLKKYNEINVRPEDLAENLGIRFGSDGVPSQPGVSSSPAYPRDSGTCGAALAGALELLRQKRLDGLKRVIEMVHRLELMDTLEVSKTEVKEIRKHSRGSRMNLQQYALDASRVRRHLDQAAPRLGLVRTLTVESKDDSEEKYTYTRWLAG